MESFATVDVKKNITETVTELFASMLEMDIGPSDGITDSGLDGSRMVGAVHLAGDAMGVVSIHVSEAMAHLMTKAMLGLAADEQVEDDQIKDVIGEISNIVGGNLKTAYINADYQCVMSTPSMTSGNDFQIDPLNIAPIRRFIFKHQNFNLLVEVCLKTQKGAMARRADTDKPDSNEIQKRIHSVDITAAIVNAVIDVYYTMLSMEVERTAETPESVAETARTVGTVKFAGDVDGIFSINVSDGFAQLMAATMLDMPLEEATDEEQIHDVIREVSNIIGGNLKSAFSDTGLALELSPPAITHGRHFRIEPLGYSMPERFVFRYQDHPIIVEAGIKKEIDKEAAAARAIAAARAPEPVDAAAEDAGPLKNLDFILDIPLEVTVELGRTKKKINELMRLGPGSVVELNQLEGEPVDILANKRLIARGVVVVEKEKYGIRITEIVRRRRRFDSLR